MKTSLEHLPASKQEQLRAIAALIQAETPADQIILFGSYARGDWVEDLATGYISDYDLLIIVKEEAEIRAVLQAPELWEKAKRIAGRVTVSPIVHALKQVNVEIRAGQYFYLDILDEGIRLFDSHRHQLAVPKALGPKERLDRATINFRYWFRSAGTFWVVATYTADRGDLAEAAFLYHQAAERYFHAVLLVFTGYKPKIHNLAELADTAAPLHPALEGAMPRAKGTEEERVFILLKKAYIEARYSKSYRVTKEELETFRHLTYDLGLRVRQACLAGMASFCGPEKVGELPEAPDPEDRGQVSQGPQVDNPEAFQAWLSAQRAEDFAHGQREGELRGRAEGMVKGQIASLLAILEARGLPMTEDVRATIDACSDPAILTRWITQAMTAASAEEIVASPLDLT